MEIKLTHEIALTLVLGTPPNYNVFEHEKIKPFGSYSGSYGKWDWNEYTLKKVGTEVLYEKYLICKDSW